MTIKEHRTWDFEDPFVVVGFPSQGLVGAIVASYLVPKLEMTLVATLDADRFPPVASIRDGRAVAPVQFYASSQVCGFDGECSQLVVVRSDVVPKPDHAKEIANEILAWCEKIGARLVVTLEGAESENAGDAVFGVRNLPADVDLKKIGAEPFPEGSITGFSGAMLTQANTRGLPVLCLITPVLPEVPDAAGAARLVEVADVLVPGIRMDAAPLEKQAAEMEAKLRQGLDEQRRAMGHGDASIMYR